MLPMGLLHPVSGSLSVDDTIITETNKFGWQAELAHVPQSIFLIDSSIAENIALGVPKLDIDHDLVKKSAMQAQIHRKLFFHGRMDILQSWAKKV